MASPVIELKSVTKTYGRERGVTDLNLAVQAGSVFGFLGPNGAGKTTTISMLVDLLRPTSGQIKIFGLDSIKDSVEVRRRIGFLAGDMALDRHLSGWQQLEYIGNLRGHFDRKYVHELAERLDCQLERRFKALSRGNKQKVGLIAALMNKPDLLILDEPTSGLDPLIQAQFNQLILEHTQAGRTAFISSHVLSEVQEICNQVCFIREGKIIATKSISDLSADSPKEFTITSNQAKQVADQLKKLTGVQVSQASHNVVSGSYLGDINKLLSLLSKHKLNDFSLENTDLETTFMKYYEAGDA